MLGIEEIGSYVPQGRASNMDLAEKFDLDAAFIETKIGVLERAIKAPDEDTSDLALKAFEALLGKASITPDDIDILIVVTQNPDYNIPHVSGIVHAKAGLPASCATFDISLGCSGYVYGLQIIASFMAASGFKKGVLITADPYSKIVNQDDKNTALLFADAATATLISDTPKYVCDGFAFGSKGDVNRSLICEDGVLEMNGRDIFNFASVSVPKIVAQSLESAELTLEDVDAFLFHQGSGYILDALGRRMRLDPAKVVKGLAHVGNTVSSSIPLLLEAEITGGNREKLVLCGFGVGLFSGKLCLPENRRMTLNEVISAIIETGVVPDADTFDATKTFEDNGVDSLDTYTILLALEELTGVGLETVPLENIDTATSLHAYITEQKS